MKNQKGLNEKLDDTRKSIREFRGNNQDNCFFSDCANKSIKSHSISESRVLSILEGVDDKNAKVVYHLENVPETDFGDAKSLSTYHQTHRKLFRKGKSDTSVFFGFCASCDGSTFEIIDKNCYESKPEINFLHTLRTKAHYLTTSRNIFGHMNSKIVNQFREADGKVEELKNSMGPFNNLINQFPDDKLVEWENVSFLESFLKEQNTAPIKSFREDSEKRTQQFFKDILDKENFPMKGKDYKQFLITAIGNFEGAIKHYKRSSTDELEIVLEFQLETINSKIENLTRLYRDDNHKAFEYLHISIEGVFPIAGAFLYHYKVGDECILTFFPESESGKTHFIFAVENGKSKYLSFLNLKTDTEFRKYASSIVLSAGSNVFLAPLFWNNLSIDIKDCILRDRTELKEYNYNLFDNSLLD
jgi:hypothetical protein